MIAFGVVSTAGRNNALQSYDFAGNDYSETDSSRECSCTVWLHILCERH